MPLLSTCPRFVLFPLRRIAASVQVRDVYIANRLQVSPLVLHTIWRLITSRKRYCDKFIWGLKKQGKRCEFCNYPCHHDCAGKVPNNCASGVVLVWINHNACTFGSNSTVLPNVRKICRGENGNSGSACCDNNMAIEKRQVYPIVVGQPVGLTYFNSDTTSKYASEKINGGEVMTSLRESPVRWRLTVIFSFTSSSSGFPELK